MGAEALARPRRWCGNFSDSIAVELNSVSYGSLPTARPARIILSHFSRPRFGQDPLLFPGSLQRRNETSLLPREPFQIRKR